MQTYFKTTNLLCEWHAGFCGGYFSPSACKKQKSLVHPLSPCYLVYLRYTKHVDDFFFWFFLAYLRLTGLLTTSEQWVSSQKGLPNIAMRTSALQLTNLCVCLTCGWTYWTSTTPRAAVALLFRGGHCLLGGKAVPWSQVQL